MAVTFSVKSNVEQMMATLQADARAMQFATIKALTRTGQAVKGELIQEMQRSFDRPTPYTLGSIFLSPATRANPVARVWLKDAAGKGTAAARYLTAEIEGGNRSPKGVERAFQRIGILPSGWFIVPGRGAKIDQYGNWSAGEVVRVMSYFRAFGEQGYSANITDKRRAKLRKGTRRTRGIEYFAVVPGRTASRHLKPGIYRKTMFGFGGAIEPIAIFVPSVTYRRRFDFFGVVQRVAEQRFPEELARALAEESSR